jgi:hypothetical protein
MQPGAVTREDVIEAFTSTLWMPNTGIVDITLGTVAANRMEGLPVWTLLVGPPSSGKTVMLDAVRSLPETFEVDTFTEAGLLSGASDRTPGVLIEMGSYGILVFPDLTVLIEKGANLGALRRVYDGALTRRLGSRGGAIEWEGKAGFLGAITEGIYTAQLGVMGERFIYYRLPVASENDRLLVGFEARRNHGYEGERSKERSRLVADFFAGLDLPQKPPPLSPEEDERLVILADLGARCRSPVVRDRFKGDTIELVPEPEGPARLAGALSQLAAGMRAFGTPDDVLWRLVREVALGGVHPIRRNVIDYLAIDDVRHVASTVAARCGLRETTLRRHLDDLEALRVLDVVGMKPLRWRLTEAIANIWTL